MTRTPELVNRLTLACGHSYQLRHWRYSPDIGTEVYCFRCMKTTHVPETATGEWRWHCQTNSRCGGYTRTCGASAELALQIASAHTRKYPQHEVWIVAPDGSITERWHPNGDPLFDVPF